MVNPMVKPMWRKYSSVVLVTTILLSGCSFNGQEVISENDAQVLKEAGKQIGELANDVAHNIMNDPELQNALMDSAKVTAKVAARFLEQVMQDPQVQEAVQSLGDQVVQEVIKQVVEENGGTMNDAVIKLIAEELQRRQGQ